VFTADWGQLLRVRTRLHIQVFIERYADTGRIGFLCWWRGDVAVARPKASTF
jgi:predicted phage gp36 major capsid-like protein